MRLFSELWLRTGAVILVAELLWSLASIECFISPPTTVVMYRHFLHLKNFRHIQKKSSPINFENSNNNNINTNNDINTNNINNNLNYNKPLVPQMNIKLRSVEPLKCQNPTESELKRELSLAYLKHIEEVIILKIYFLNKFFVLKT